MKMKKYLSSLAALMLLSACNTYSNEMVFYYEDEEATPEAMAAPSKGVSSEELVIPSALREKNNSSSAQKPAPLPASSSAETQNIPTTYAQESVSLTETQNLDFSAVTPQVYAIAATRATNKMLDDTQNLYQAQKPKLLIHKAEKMNTALPDGLYYADKVVYDTVDGSQNFVLVDKLDNADFQLKVQVDAYANSGESTPVIIYHLALLDKSGKEIDSWTQDLKQLQNDDKSWW